MNPRLLLLAVLTGPAFGAVSAENSLYQLKPGVTNRGQAPTTWLLDLRNQSPAAAQSAAAKLSSRIYGRSNRDLHQPLVIKTAFANPKIFAIGINAVSSGGSDLVVKTNGVLAGRQAWPSAGSTHRVDRLFHLALADGPQEISLEVTQPGGVVVVQAYYLADSLAQLPQNPPPLALGATVPPSPPVSAADRFANVPMTGGKLVADDGYRGIWYYNQPTRDEYKYKYSGGFATYPQQHAPIAIYSKEAEKTFFVYGGTTARNAEDKQVLLHMVSYFDHKSRQVPRPRILLNKQTEDAHDNPTLQIDERGYLWIFSSSHGTGRPSYIHRSARPWSIDEFERILVTNFSYTQPWHIPGEGFLFLHTRYGGGKSLGINAARCLFWMTSHDGHKWSEPAMLAGIEQGDYQVSWRSGNRISTAFDFHPTGLGLNSRANIYYLETRDFAKTWQTVDGRKITPPLAAVDNPALAFNSRSQEKLVYLKDLNFDRQGHPVILFLTSKGFEPGPANGPREWQTIRWSGKEWLRRPFTASDNNYDHGSLYVEPDGTWRVIAPTETGPQPYNPGGEMAMWTSTDEGTTWTRVKDLTRNSPRNHTYARRPLNAHPDFYAIWADGHGRQPSESYLYFTNQKGDQVWRLPGKMDGEFATPSPCN